MFRIRVPNFQTNFKFPKIIKKFFNPQKFPELFEDSNSGLRSRDFMFAMQKIEQDLNIPTHPSPSISPSVRPCRYAAGKNHSSSIVTQGAKYLVVVQAEFLFENKFLEQFGHRPIPLLLSPSHRRNEFQQCPFLNE